MTQETQTPTGVFVRLPISSDQAQKMYQAYCHAFAISTETTRGEATAAALLAIGTPVAVGGLKIWGNVSRENAKDLGPQQAVLMFGGSDTGADDINLVDAEDAQAALAAAQADSVKSHEVKDSKALGDAVVAFKLMAGYSDVERVRAAVSAYFKALKGPEA